VAVHQESLEVGTRGRGFVDVTAEVARVVHRSGISVGICTVFVQHTSASLVIQENADPAVLRDLARWLGDVAPESRRWEHDAEGADDMPAHARAAITRSAETIPIGAGRLLLGTWQALYLWEHRARPHTRSLIVHVAGEAEA
jgi:secondary thiamine-phosphate synthase enzyme